jgi:aminoglycoside phosphotransferase family enzyme/predicted kinase
MTTDPLTQDLIDAGFERIETHISRVFLGPGLVYKVKKAVYLGFLDFRALDTRRRFCEAEVTLNRRLAPDVYLDVVPITRTPAGKHVLGGAGEPVEWAVQMRRLDATRSFESLLEHGLLGHAELDALATRLARFHAEARADAEVARQGELAVIEHNVRENFEQTRDSATRYVEAEERARTERYQLGFLSAHPELFRQRLATGRVREGHGDLRLEHCYLEPNGEICVIDCIEFNERFRSADVCADIAFLCMDLTWHGRADLSETFLAAYARESGDYDLYALVDFYSSYRAYVRGKVASILADDASAPGPARQRAVEQARKFYLLAAAEGGEPLQAPLLVAVGGLIASGKSTLARGLGELLNAPVLSADRTRKQLSGVAELEPLRDAAFEGHYAADATRRVYDELLRRARLVLSSARPVVVDASFRSSSDRAAFAALASELGVAFHFVECVAPEAALRERLRTRERGPSVSDGRVEILESFMDSYEPADPASMPGLLRLDTTRPLAANLERVRAQLRS